MADVPNGYPKWRQTWFSPATIMLGITMIGVIWTTSARMTSLEKDGDSIRSRMSVLDAQLITKDWFTREVQYQREMYASKSSVDLIAQKTDEIQRQLNVIDSLVRGLNNGKRP